MNQSHRNLVASRLQPSPAKTTFAFTAKAPQLQCNLTSAPIDGSLDDAAAVRQLVVTAIKNCGLSRAQIAERMSLSTGTEVTERMLNAYTAASREDYRFPSQLERALCEATGNYDLITFRAQLMGLRLIDETESELLELGREYLAQKRSAARIAALESKLAEVTL